MTGKMSTEQEINYLAKPVSKSTPGVDPIKKIPYVNLRNLIGYSKNFKQPEC